MRHQLGCDRCNKFCWICRSTKADDNCGRCQRAARKLLASTPTSSTNKYLRLSAIVNGAEALRCKDAAAILKKSGLSVKCINLTAGGGAAGTTAVKYAAVAFASRMLGVSLDGGNVAEHRVTIKKPAPSILCRTIQSKPMPASVAAQAVAEVSQTRLVEPFMRDAPATALAIASELFAKASEGEKDALVLAALRKALAKVRAVIVQKSRRPRTHAHGWERSNIDVLKGFARDEAEKAIRQVRALTPAAVAARRALCGNQPVS